MYYLEHKRDHRFITCYSYQQAIKEYYNQYRDPDGSIPWTVKYNDEEIDL